MSGKTGGADETARAQSATRWAFGFSCVYGAIIGLGLLFFATPIAGLLAAGEADQAFAATYLRIVGLSMFGYGLVVIANAAMNARDKAVWSMSISLGRIFVIYLPLAWVGVTMFGYIGIVVAAALANVIGGGAAVFATQRVGVFAIAWRQSSRDRASISA